MDTTYLSAVTVAKLRSLESQGIKFYIGTTYGLRKTHALKDIDVSIARESWDRFIHIVSWLPVETMRNTRTDRAVLRVLDNRDEQIIDYWCGNVISGFSYEDMTPDKLTTDENGFTCWKEATSHCFRDMSGSIRYRR